ncbi:MAG: hypothetical protein J5835_05040 [Bacteroidales bacterium]|nr:hypothetical protein [Bacteroidales bacterium]
MSQISKVKLMDSGTALFKAGNRGEADQKLKAALLIGGGTIDEEGDCLVLDFSTGRYWQFIQARLEETSIPGTWAAVLRTGDAPKLPFDLPSKKAVSLTRDILKALAE